MRHRILFVPIAIAIAFAIAFAAVVTPAFADDLDAARVGELATRVEQLLERRFVTVPPVVTATPAEVEKALAADARARVIAAGASEEEADRTVAEAKIALALQGGRLTALYLPSCRRILVQPALFDALVERGVVPPGERHRVIELVIVHELVHALQDQEVGLFGFLAIKDDDPARRTERMHARRAVAEGQAMLVQDLVGKLLAKESPAWNAAVVAAGRIAPGAMEPEGDRERYREGVIYRGGAAMMRGRYESGGAAATWDAFRDPPSDLAGLASKSSAFDSDYAARIAKAFDNERPSFGPDWRAKATSASPAIGLASQLAALPKERRDEIVASVRALAAVVGGTQAGARLAVAVVVASDETTAPALDRDLLAMQTAGLTAMGANAPQQSEKYADGMHTIVRREQIVFKDGSTLAIAMLHGRRGLVTIQVTSLNGGHDAVALRDIATRFVRATEAVKVSESAAAPKPE